MSRHANHINAFIRHALLSCLLLIPTAQAQDNAPAMEGLVLPEVISESLPNFNRRDREALVHVRYTIKADGKTADVEVVDGFYNSLFSDAAVKAVQAWTYKPATLDGEAIDWLNNEYVFAFHINGVDAAISPQVMQGFNAISELLADKDYDEAVSRIEAMLANQDVVKTLFDYAFLHDALATAYLGAENLHEALAASIKATTSPGRVYASVNGGTSSPDEALLTPELQLAALRKRFLLNGSLGHNVDGLRTYERLLTLQESANNDDLASQAEEMRRRLVSPDPMGQIGGLAENTWTYAPSRRIFAVTDLRGEIDSIDVRCKRRNAQLPFETEVEWALPESWGACTLTFNGKEGAEFTMYEFLE